uniref:Uncharacterized protein n=1 Tax=Xylella fastidiosa TaxID=2371 RepID=Q4FGL3_XYLFS|nr:hypothetical protein [Xylella fastidiosa]
MVMGGSSPIAVWCAPGASQTLVGSVTVIASVVLVGCSPVAIPSRSRVIGFMEWVPYEVQMAFCANLRTRGYSVIC